MPRKVHFSSELSDSLGKIVQETDAERTEKALEAWRAIFLIRDLFVKGENVTRFLSKNVKHFLSELKKTDGLLLHFGMHHFHLSGKLEKSGEFSKRSDYLLFAIIADADAFFVDVRLHPAPESLVWFRQDLLNIVYSNWPELVEPHMLRGVKGDKLTNEQKKELRRKNINHVTELGDDAISPIGGGMMCDGSSTLYGVRADKLLNEINRHQSYLDSQPVELRSKLEAKGMEIAGAMEFQLVSLDSLSPSDELIEALSEGQCLSRDLCRMGFAIVEATTRLPVVISLEGQH